MSVFDKLNTSKCATARSTAAGPLMFEHRGGHPAPPDPGTASRLPRDHGSLALSITDALPLGLLSRARTHAHTWNRIATARSRRCGRPGTPMIEHRHGHPEPSGAGTASRLPRGHGSLALSWSNIRVRIGCLCCVRESPPRGVVVTVKPSQRRISDSPHRSGDCVTTTWCGASLTVLKHPHFSHSHASVVKYPCSDRASPKTRERGQFVTVIPLRCEIRASPR